MKTFVEKFVELETSCILFERNQINKLLEVI